MDKLKKAFSVAEYITGYLNDSLSEVDKGLLEKWLQEKEENKVLFEHLKDEFFVQQQMKTFERFDVANALQKFKNQKVNVQETKQANESRNFKWLAIAAAIVVLAGLSYFFFLNSKKGEFSSHQISHNNSSVNGDVAPGGNRAILTLADGSTIMLDSADNGNIATQGNASVVKTADGKLVYRENGVSSEKIQYNTVSTPRGGQYFLELSDGTKVWLNAASSITYPATFGSTKRVVQISGEAYFEVAHNPSQPFLVTTNGMEVSVLGTIFNVNAYGDDDIVNTTLIRGSVAIKSGTEYMVIKPGEQAAKVITSGRLSLRKDVDIESEIAWKNGKFNFQEENIRQIMKKLERWYDISVTYQQGVSNEKFIGTISRSVSLSQVLNMLGKTGVVKFSRVGKNIIVK